MVFQFTPQPKPPVKPANDDGHARKRAAVFSLSAFARMPDGTARYSSSGYGPRRSGSPEFRSGPDPWDGGDAA